MSYQPTTLTLIAAITLGFALGCGGEGGGSTSDLEALADQMDAQAAIDQAAAEQAAKEKAAADAKSKADQLANESPSEIGTEDFQRGQKLKGGGYLSTTLRAGIVGQQKLNMYTVENALNLFWGLEGRYPKSHEEFMEKVIEFNQIELEPLQEPYEYWYDAEDHTLYKRVKPEVVEEADADADTAAETANE